ncbi:MAG: hypothetical protein JRD89_17275 [Deltaproteobacteria bacterium]|nr:hypothetical protein [Deltaproteobacteria bacterium]
MKTCLPPHNVGDQAQQAQQGYPLDVRRITGKTATRPTPTDAGSRRSHRTATVRQVELTRLPAIRSGLDDVLLPRAAVPVARPRHLNPGARLRPLEDSLGRLGLTDVVVVARVGVELDVGVLAARHAGRGHLHTLEDFLVDAIRGHEISYLRASKASRPTPMTTGIAEPAVGGVITGAVPGGGVPGEDGASVEALYRDATCC